MSHKSSPNSSEAKITDLIPGHVGLILDGNRRWAKSKNLPSSQGHKVGYDNLRIIAQGAFERGVSYVSAYIFSTENWNRSHQEVSYLMKLVLKFFKQDARELHKQGIKIEWLGVVDNLNQKIIDAINYAENLTKDNKKGTLGICFNYGGYSEIVEAVKKIAKLNVAANEITQELIDRNLFAPDIPKLDLVIRTSGEQRLSNFMLWRTAYSELYFTDVMWPDFTIDQLELALEDYAQRSRRFGK
jgi:undecaprenyl diphosphate synthase